MDSLLGAYSTVMFRNNYHNIPRLNGKMLHDQNHNFCMTEYWTELNRFESKFTFCCTSILFIWHLTHKQSWSGETTTKLNTFIGAGHLVTFLSQSWEIPFPYESFLGCISVILVVSATIHPMISCLLFMFTFSEPHSGFQNVSCQSGKVGLTSTFESFITALKIDHLQVRYDPNNV